MPTSIQRDYIGPDWPLGFISVAIPGTPVNIMSLVDPNNVNSPNTPVPPASGIIPALTQGYVPRAHQIMFQAFKPGVAHGVQLNTGYIYICRAGANGGAGNRDDTGSIVRIITPGTSWDLVAAALNFDSFSPYRYFIDADNAGDGAFVTLLPQG